MPKVVASEIGIGSWNRMEEKTKKGEIQELEGNRKVSRSQGLYRRRKLKKSE